MKKKKILMIIPTLSNGGAERVVSNLSIGLEKEYDIDILLDYDKVGYDYRGNIIKCLPNVKREPKGLLKIFMNLKKYVILRTMKKKHQYDVYISHLRLSNFWNALSGSNNCITIATVHNSITRKLALAKGLKIWFHIEKFSYENVTRVVTVSHGASSELKNIYGLPAERIVTIWNGTDIVHIHKLSQETFKEGQKEWLNFGGGNIVTVGRYTTQKAQWHLIRAFSKVLQVYPEAKLIILGEGELRDYYERLIDNLNIKASVELCGFQENPFAFIAHSNIFVLSSLWEGMPCTLVEALCCGVPCVVTDFNSGSREILRIDEALEIPSKGYLIGSYGVVTSLCSGKKYVGKEPLEKQEEDLANAMIYLLGHPDECARLVQNNNNRIEEFSLEEMVNCWRRVIES